MMSEIDPNLAAGLARRFRIVRRLGEGGMGAVFLAEQIAVGNRPVALKVLLRALLENPDFLRRFRDEAASTGRIRHPNVVTIHESGQGDDGTPYIAMEYLEGEPLRHALETRGPLPVSECAEILQQAARGLNAAHKLGIIHRDLKPDNIFLTYPEDVDASQVDAPAPSFVTSISDRRSTGTPWRAPTIGRPQPPLPPVVVKIVDFGIAKLRESATHTLTGMVLGTPAYMSYEQASGMKSDELDARSDIYSLGVVTYEMLTSRLPFESDTPVGYLRKHLQDAPPPFRTVKPDLPALPEVESVVMKALTKDRDQRYGSVLEFAREFAQSAAADSQPVAQPELKREGSTPQLQAGFAPPPKPIVPTAAEAETACDQPTPAAALASGPRSTQRLQGIGAPHFKLPWLLGALGIVILIAVASFWFPRAANRPAKELKNLSKPVLAPATAAGTRQMVAPKQSEEWGLPIKLGQSRAEARQVLGTPNEVVDTFPLGPRGVTLEWYYSSGIVGRFDDDRLFGITLNPSCDYKGFVPYSGAVVNGIKLTDSKNDILRQLGKETKIEDDSLEIGTDLDKPVVWPAKTRYYWRKAGYTVQVDFLRQAQSISANPVVISAKDAVSVILVYK